MSDTRRAAPLRHPALVENEDLLLISKQILELTQEIHTLTKAVGRQVANPPV